VAASDDPRPGLKVWAWDRNLLLAFAATLAGFAGAVLTVAFTFKSSGRVIALVVVGVLIAATLTFLTVAANKPDREKRKRGPGMVAPEDSFSLPTESVGRKRPKSAREPR
jgi:hypothetical protein